MCHPSIKTVFSLALVASTAFAAPHPEPNKPDGWWKDPNIPTPNGQPPQTADAHRFPLPTGDMKHWPDGKFLEKGDMKPWPTGKFLQNGDIKPWPTGTYLENGDMKPAKPQKTDDNHKPNKPEPAKLEPTGIVRRAAEAEANWAPHIPMPNWPQPTGDMKQWPNGKYLEKGDMKPWPTGKFLQKGDMNPWPTAVLMQTGDIKPAKPQKTDDNHKPKKPNGDSKPKPKPEPEKPEPTGMVRRAPVPNAEVKEGYMRRSVPKGPHADGEGRENVRRDPDDWKEGSQKADELQRREAEAEADAEVWAAPEPDIDFVHGFQGPRHEGNRIEAREPSDT